MGFISLVRLPLGAAELLPTLYSRQPVADFCDGRTTPPGAGPLLVSPLSSWIASRDCLVMMTALIAFVTISLMILLTGLYVAAGFATVSARRTKISQMAAQGDSLSRMLLPVLEDNRKRSLRRRVPGRYHHHLFDPGRVCPESYSHPVDRPADATIWHFTVAGDGPRAWDNPCRSLVFSSSSPPCK